jgi:hypothetical protein
VKRKLSPAQEETLRAHRFKPGVSPNPGGVSEKRELRRAYRELLERPWPKDRKKTWAQAIALAVMKKAAEGDTRAAAEIADRTEGRVRIEQEIVSGPTFGFGIGAGNTFRRIQQMSDEELIKFTEERMAVLKNSPPPKPQ